MRWVAGWLAFVACSWGSVASADPASVAAYAPAEQDVDRSERALIERGIALRKAEDDRGARAAFEEAWTRSGSPEALAQLALSEQALGLWLEAHEHLRAALEHAGHPWILQHRTILEAALAEMESRFGRLEVSCNVAGADVSIDGRQLGETPLAAPLQLLAGRSVIQLSADGYFDVTRQVQIDAGALSRLHVTLTSSASTASLEPASLAPSSVQGANAPSLAPHRSLDGSGTTSARDILQYGSLGLAAAGAAVGFAGYVMREVNVTLYNDNSHCSVDPARPRSEECADAAAAWRLGEGLAIGGFAAAGVFGAVGLYLWLNEPSDGDGAAAGCGFGLGNVACSARF